MNSTDWLSWRACLRKRGILWWKCGYSSWLCNLPAWSSRAWRDQSKPNKRSARSIHYSVMQTCHRKEAARSIAPRWTNWRLRQCQKSWWLLLCHLQRWCHSAYSHNWVHHLQKWVIRKQYKLKFSIPGYGMLKDSNLRTIGKLLVLLKDGLYMHFLCLRNKWIWGSFCACNHWDETERSQLTL